MFYFTGRRNLPDGCEVEMQSVEAWRGGLGGASSLSGVHVLSRNVLTHCGVLDLSPQALGRVAS